MTVYALLVGIDEYAVVRDLNGCVRDVERMEEFLQARVIPTETNRPVNSDEYLQIKKLINKDATREALIEGFRTHLGQADDNDVAFFYYSGHGSEESAPPEFWHLDPTHKNQTLVCHDSRMHASAWDLADKELGYLISELTAGKNQEKFHTLVILDSCHSGGGTRDSYDVRMTMADLRERKLSDYIVPQDAVETISVGEHWYRPPEGKHILMSACRPDQLAKERVINKETRGVFSYHLLTALQSAGPNLTYRNLSKHVNALVQVMVKDQVPQLEAGLSEDQPFLGGKVQKVPLAYTARYNADVKHWVIDGGTIHGISATTQPETTKLALFPTLEVAETLDLGQAKGQADVISAGTAESKIRGTYDGQPLDKKQSYQALVISTPLPPLLVKFEGDEALLAPIREDLAIIGPDDTPSVLVKEAETDEDIELAELMLEALPDKQVYRLSRVSDPNRFAVDTPLSDSKAVEKVVDYLEHMSRWLTTYQLANPQTKFKDDDVLLEFYTVDASGEQKRFEGGDELRLTYSTDDEAPLVAMKIVNYSSRELYCGLLNLTSSYGVSVAPTDNHNKVVIVPAKDEAWVLGGDPIPIEIPDEKWEAGITEVKDMFKLIVSTSDFDAKLLEQESLMTTSKAGIGFSVGAQEDTLSRLLVRVGLRAANWGAAAKVYSDWDTKDLIVSTTRPR